jgi:hypothetical protein
MENDDEFILALAMSLEPELSTSTQPESQKIEQLMKVSQNIVEAKYQQKKDNEKCKMVVMVRKDLKMGVGKVAAQVSHASLGLYKELVKQQDQTLLKRWEKEGEATIVVSVDNEQEMTTLAAKAAQNGLGSYSNNPRFK